MKRLVDCAILFAVLISVSAVYAAAPGLINYQGRMTDTAGQPVTTSVNVTFTFWNATVGGVQLNGFSDTDTVTPDADGIYSTTIGDDAGNLIPASIFDGDAVWLNVQINGEDLLPRKRMVSVGYAIQTGYADTALTSTRALSADQADNADSLQGQPASAFMPAGTDNWVNTAGDSMTGRLEILAGSNTNILSVLNSSGADSAKAIEGFAAAAGAVTNYGGYFHARGDSSRGVYGQADGPVAIGVQGVASAVGGVTNYGGSFEAAGDGGRGVLGDATATGAVTNYGGFFQSTGDFGNGVYGRATGASGVGVAGLASATGAAQNYGGSFEAAGNFGRGVYAKASATGPVVNYGGYFEAAGNASSGVRGTATATGAADNTGGDFKASGNGGRGVQGVADATGPTTNYGGWFGGYGDNGIGVLGTATATGDVLNHGGFFTASGDRGRGVFSRASATGPVINFGGWFEALGDNGRGVYGYVTGDQGQGVYGEATATGDVANVGGYFEAAGDRGRGVYARATGASGKGVFGIAAATGNVTNYGGHFLAFGDNGQGVRGEAGTLGPVTNYGGYFIAVGDTSRGVYAAGEAYDFYASGPGTNYGPFTGAHEVQFDAGFPSDPKPGQIVVTTGPAKVRRDTKGQVSISSTLPTVKLADRPMDKAVFGVLVRELPLTEDHWYKPAAGERFGVVNALGEGRVWVCDAAGPIAMSDYITSSAVPGYGQKQADDLQHAYTVGKVIEGVDWDTVTESIEHDGQVYKVYLIAVVYNCG